MQNAFFMAPKAEGGEWAQKKEMPEVRVTACGNEVDGKIYAIGGYTQQGDNFSFVPEVNEYDPATDTWIKKGNMLFPRTTSTCVLNGKIYVIGGGTGHGAVATVLEWTPEGWPLSFVSPEGNKTWGNIKSK
jgi:N-acetylneuraminic acid mutarotase